MKWAVHLIDRAFGVGKKLGTVRAADRRAAELIAANRFPGRSFFVSLAGGRSRRTSGDHEHHHQPSRRTR